MNTPSNTVHGENKSKKKEQNGGGAKFWKTRKDKKLNNNRYRVPCGLRSSPRPETGGLSVLPVPHTPEETTRPERKRVEENDCPQKLSFVSYLFCPLRPSWRMIVAVVSYTSTIRIQYVPNPLKENQKFSCTVILHSLYHQSRYDTRHTHTRRSLAVNTDTGASVAWRTRQEKSERTKIMNARRNMLKRGPIGTQTWPGIRSKKKWDTPVRGNDHKRDRLGRLRVGLLRIRVSPSETTLVSIVLSVRDDRIEKSLAWKRRSNRHGSVWNGLVFFM